MGKHSNPLPPPAPDEPPTSNARIATELLRAARLICARRSGAGGRPLTLSAYLDSLLRAPIQRDYAAIVKEIAEEQRRAGGGPE